MAITNATLAQQILDMVNARIQFDAEHQEWLGGVVGGGPFSDGKYLLTNPINGDQVYVTCPAQMEEDVDGNVVSASASAAAATQAVIDAAAHAASSLAEAGNSETSRLASEAAKALSETARSGAESASTVAQAQAGTATTEAANALASANAAALDAIDALASETAAGLSEVAAAASETAAAASAASAAAIVDVWASAGTLATTSGTSHILGSIPAGALHLRIVVTGLSTNGANNIRVRFGDSGGIDSAGNYGSASTRMVGSSLATGSTSTNFQIQRGNAADTYSGIMDFSLDQASGKWIGKWMFGRDDNATATAVGGGSWAYPTGPLTQIEFGSADTFDAGRVEVFYML